MTQPNKAKREQLIKKIQIEEYEKLINKLNEKFKEDFDQKLDQEYFSLVEKEINLDQVIEAFPDINLTKEFIKEIKKIEISSTEEHPCFLNVDLKDDDLIYRDDEKYKEYRLISDLLDPMANNTLNEIEEKTKKLYDEWNKDKSFIEKIPGRIRRSYQRTSDDLSDLRNWKAKVKLGNSVGEDDPDVGDWDNIRYVCIGIMSETIVPIAIGDEHHRGYDYIQFLQDKNQIPEDIYVSICEENNYINYPDRESEMNHLLRAVKIWKKNGGQDGLINFRGHTKTTLTFSDFIRLSRFTKPHLIDQKLAKDIESKLMPMGKRFISHLEKVKNELERYHKRKELNDNNFFQNAGELSLLVGKIWQFDKKMNETLRSLNEAILSSDITKTEEAIFSFNGLKNTIHILLKETIKKEEDAKKNRERLFRSFSADYLVEMFGNLSLALQEMDRLSD